ncbi:MAG: hypothetical protein C0490_13225 [Marivirga sp.]|nr:hypothetical protein [Marivirga sp.]
MIKQKSIDYGLLVISLILYAYLGFIVERHETYGLLISYFAVFAIYLYVIFKSDEDRIAHWIFASVLFRTLLVFSVPNLSDDFYRFIWDGRLWASGYHPFAEIPSYYVTNDNSIEGINAELFQKLNSPDYFTIYPPVAQFIFWLSVKLSPHSIYGSLLTMKLVVLMAEIGSIVVIKKILSQYNLGRSRVLVYALNPLVILELTGNIHLEAVLIFFLLLSLFFLNKQNLFPSGLAFSFAVCVKLIPLIFLPAILPTLGWKKALPFYLIITVTCLILFLPLWNVKIIEGFQNSLGYYFNKFEFNASIYYLVRACGYWYYGFNIVGIAGWTLGLISCILILILSTRPWWSWWSERIAADPVIDDSSTNPRLFETGMFVLLTYLLFTTTLHPWYITTLLAISVFTNFRFTILWTALIFLTYAGYSESGFEENLWFTALEYISVLGYLAYELLWKRKYLSLHVS